MARKKKTALPPNIPRPPRLNIPAPSPLVIPPPPPPLNTPSNTTLNIPAPPNLTIPPPPVLNTPDSQSATSEKYQYLKYQHQQVTNDRKAYTTSSKDREEDSSNPSIPNSRHLCTSTVNNTPRYPKLVKKQTITVLKKFNWKTIDRQNERTLWDNYREDHFNDDVLFERLEKDFKLRTSVMIQAETEKKRVPKILSDEQARNLMIGLYRLKKLRKNPKKVIVEASSELDDVAIKFLIQSIPDRKAFDKLAKYEGQYDELVDAEQFLYWLNKIDRLMVRLKHIKFMRRYDIKIEDIRESINSITTTCKDLINSDRFKNFLYLVLRIGNYLNSKRKTVAFGFDISFLTSLKNTRRRGEGNMLNFLCSYINKNKNGVCRNIHSFIDDLDSVCRTSRVKDDQIGKKLFSIEGKFKNLTRDIEYLKREEGNKQYFTKFYKRVNDEVPKVRLLHKQMTQVYDQFCEFYCIDSKTTKEELFADLRAFREDYLEAESQNLIREEKEKKKQNISAAISKQRSKATGPDKIPKQTGFTLRMASCDVKTITNQLQSTSLSKWEHLGKIDSDSVEKEWLSRHNSDNEDSDSSSTTITSQTSVKTQISTKKNKPKNQ